MKKIIITSVCLLVLSVGAFFSRPAYRNWQHARLQTQALEFLARGDFRNAGLAAQQALKLKPADVECCRVMARVAESVRSPESVNWWRRVLDLQPDSLSNRLDLARSAFLFGDVSRAGQVLSSVAATNRNSAVFHQLAAMVAVAENNLPQADWHFAEAARLDPLNKSVQMNQAVLHLHARNTNLVQSALATLESLSGDVAFRRDALRHLTMTAVRNRDFAQAEELSRQLQTAERTTFEDRVLYLSVLEQAKNPDFAAQLENLKAECVKTPVNIPVLSAWLGAHRKLDEALRWLRGLPDDVQANQTCRIALADVLTQKADWEALENLLQGQSWGELEFVRLAYLTRAAREQKQEIVAQDHWRVAVRAAADRVKALAGLARLSAEWKMEAAREDLLWTIVQRYPAERWALQQLQNNYLSAGNTQGLLRIYAMQLNFDPDNVVAKNNYASVSLLLNSQLNRAHELAQTVYEKYPKNPAFATTYAYSLHLRERTAEALQVMEKLPSPQLESPSVAVYYGVILAASGNPAKAGKYLALAAADSGLLPEEKGLIKAAR